MVEHARRRRLERVAGGPLVQRLRRPHLLGRRDVDVPVAAGPASGPRRGDEQLPLRPPDGRRAARHRHRLSAARGSRGRARSTAPSRFRRRCRSTARACSSSTSPPTSPLAQWQYYLATGDKKWLANRGWPVISERGGVLGLTGDARQRWHTTTCSAITGPDEENPDVNDEVYTNVAARATLQDAIAGRAGARQSGPRQLVADRRRPDRAQRRVARDPSRVQRLRRAAGQAGRRHPAAVSVGVPDVAAGRPERPGLLHRSAATPTAHR